jgi:hypothetical protein
VSTNRTRVELVAIDTVARAELVDLALDALLLSFEPRELGLTLRQRAQVLSDKRADRAARSAARIRAAR